MDIASLISRQREFFLSGSTGPLEFRRQGLIELGKALEKHENELLAALHNDLGKSPLQAYASELGYLLGEVRHASKNLHRWMKPERRRAPMAAWPSSGELHREPLGVCLIIGPWNFPLQLLLAPLVGAIAAGNTAVLKPSEHAPHTSSVISKMLRDHFDENFITVVEGAQDCAEALLLEKFDKIFFTGSTSTGRHIMSAAARHLTPVTLELGGKSPCIIAADAPIALTARRIVWGKFMNAGQTCTAPDHLWVDRRSSAALLDAIRVEIRRSYGDKPQESPDYGRIIHQRHFDRLRALLSEGRIFHGGHTDAEALYIEPTILTDVPPDAAVMNEEIFGPILPVFEYEDITQVLAKMRNLPPPLALYLFTADRGMQRRVLAESRSGGVCINDTISHMIGPDMPFGGVGESGMGTYHGRASFECFSQLRSVLSRSLKLDLPFRYPPIKVSLETLKRSMRYLF